MALEVVAERYRSKAEAALGRFEGAKSLGSEKIGIEIARDLVAGLLLVDPTTGDETLKGILQVVISTAGLAYRLPTYSNIIMQVRRIAVPQAAESAKKPEREALRGEETSSGDEQQTQPQTIESLMRQVKELHQKLDAAPQQGADQLFQARMGGSYQGYAPSSLSQAMIGTMAANGDVPGGEAGKGNTTGGAPAVADIGCGQNSWNWAGGSQYYGSGGGYANYGNGEGHANYSSGGVNPNYSWPQQCGQRWPTPRMPIAADRQLAEDPWIGGPAGVTCFLRLAAHNGLYLNSGPVDCKYNQVTGEIIGCCLRPAGGGSINFYASVGGRIQVQAAPKRVQELLRIIEPWTGEWQQKGKKRSRESMEVNEKAPEPWELEANNGTNYAMAAWAEISSDTNMTGGWEAQPAHQQYHQYVPQPCFQETAGLPHPSSGLGGA